jgi:DNA-binding transcriptional LysR family regulator
MADATAAELMPGLVEILETEAPGVTLRVVPLTTRDPRALLDEQACDLAVGFFPSVLADMTAHSQGDEPLPFAHQRLYDGQYVCVVRQGHPLADRPLTLDTYCEARHMLVSFSGRAYGFIDEALAALGRRRQVVLTVNQFFTAGRVVAHSNLLTVLPRHFVRVTGIADELVLMPLPFEVPAVHVDALWHRRNQLRGSHQWLRQAVQSATERAQLPRQ